MTSSAQDANAEPLVAAHDRVWSEVDPLLRPPEPGLEVAPLVTVDAAHGRGVARVLAHEVGPDEEAALWGAVRSWRLRFHVAGADRPAVFAELVDAFDHAIEEVASSGDDDTAAIVTLPSRDLDLPVVLSRRGFAATTVIAVRRRGSSPSSGMPDDGTVRVRAAVDDDLDVLVEMAVALNAFDAAFGGVTARPSASQLLGEALEGALRRDEPWTWVAEDGDGAVLGFIEVQPPAAASWIAPLTVVPEDRVAYLGMMYVRPDRRGLGIGPRLVAAAHEAVDAAGVEVTLLHHALPNPVSTPFWARQGYRPLWTAWQRRPAWRGAAPG
jgi:GNAT superfamily N-acetyltransferase